MERKYEKNELVALDGLLVIRTPYERVRVQLVKEIPGCTFRADLGGWASPVGSIREVLGWCQTFKVAVPPAIEVVHKYVLSQEVSMITLSSAARGKHLEIPGLRGELLEHQHVAIDYLSRVRRAFLADAMGVGKTLSAMGTLEYCNSPSLPSYPALVVCPPKLTLNWKAEYHRFFPDRSVQVLSKKSEAPDGSDVVIVGHAIIHALKDTLTEYGFRSLVADESHNFKTATAQRTKALKQIAVGKYNRSKKTWDGAMPSNAIQLALTGTPCTIRPSDYVPQLEVIGRLDDFGGSMGFYRTFCDAKQDAHKQWDFSGHSNLELLNRQLRQTCYVRRERMDVVKGLLPAIHSDVIVPLEEKWLKEYQAAEADVVQYLVDRATEIALQLGADVRSAAVRARMKAESGKHLVRISILRKLSGMGKVEFAKEWVSERVSEGLQVIVAAHHREVVDALAVEFGNCKIQGGMSTKEVEEVKRKFQAGEAPVIVLSIEAGKEGHTLTAASEVLFVEFPWTSTTFDQVWTRAHRQGQTKVVGVTSILGAATRDIPHFDMLGRRRSIVETATIGSQDTGGQMVMDLLDMGLLNASQELSH